MSAKSTQDALADFTDGEAISAVSRTITKLNRLSIAHSSMTVSSTASTLTYIAPNQIVRGFGGLSADAARRAVRTTRGRPQDCLLCDNGDLGIHRFMSSPRTPQRKSIESLRTWARARSGAKNQEKIRSFPKFAVIRTAISRILALPLAAETRRPYFSLKDASRIAEGHMPAVAARESSEAV